jgi:hexosaminidase
MIGSEQERRYKKTFVRIPEEPQERVIHPKLTTRPGRLFAVVMYARDLVPEEKPDVSAFVGCRVLTFADDDLHYERPIDQAEQKEQMTPVMPGTANPVYNQIFEFQVRPEKDFHTILVLQVWNRESDEEEVLIGEHLRSLRRPPRLALTRCACRHGARAGSVALQRLRQRPGAAVVCQLRGLVQAQARRLARPHSKAQVRRRPRAPASLLRAQLNVTDLLARPCRRREMLLQHALALACLLAAARPCAASVSTLWPLPVVLETGSQSAQLLPSSFRFNVGSQPPCVATGPVTQLLQSAAQRYQGLVFWRNAHAERRAGDLATIGSITLCPLSPNTTLSFPADESYVLDVNTTAALLMADTVWGIMRGLETFSQLVEFDIPSQTYQVSSLPVTIKDSPRFAWRGLLVDSSRHYLRVQTLLRMIDAMSYSKFNVLHWHIVDAESFPFVSTSYPSLSANGAYYPSYVYKPSDVANVVQYAYARGIRVVPEFDGPGHAAAWGSDITANCPKYTGNINNIPLTPATPQTLQVLSGVYADAAAVFDDDFMHLGGDEVVQGCWAQDPNVTAWMQAQGFTSTLQVYQWFVDHMSALANAVGKRVIQWQEVFDNGLLVAPTTVIEVWKSAAELQEVVSAGFSGILAAGYYLDQQIPNKNQTFYAWVDTWRNFYQNDPCASLSPSLCARVLGGEACMWGEGVSDASIDTRVWPRACGTAERLWSPSDVKDVNNAETRLMAHACRLQRRGIAASPIAPDFCLMPDD